MRQRALVALARTGEDPHLLSYARMLADAGLLREIRFLHVLPSGHDAAALLETQAAVEAEVAKHFGQPSARVLTSCHVVSGERVDTMLEKSSEWRSDVILLGHRKSRSGQRSLARRLAMISACSVWLVPEGAPISLTRILAPVDLSDHAADGLSMALDVARTVDVEECVALHVFFDDAVNRSARHVVETGAREQRAVDAFLAEIDTSGVTFSTQCDEAPRPAPAILRVAGNRGSDLIVMNTRGRSRSAAILLGSVTTEVAVGTPVAMLIVKHFGAMMGLFTALKESQFWNRQNSKTN